MQFVMSFMPKLCQHNRHTATNAHSELSAVCIKLTRDNYRGITFCGTWYVLTVTLGISRATDLEGQNLLQLAPVAILTTGSLHLHLMSNQQWLR